ncbi:unnamed protein product [Callosobruchus maculatus]|uniref:DUF8206 domain-containing protein n=1 Tax=Callosobruchus maculatus TaxID=64391 RepID=A0A653BR12_CALMS|nr:unnamed protein product [Callosobruchus maculatus]
MAAANEISELMKSTHIEDKDINILLLGTTGVGKSTFINSIANYLSFDNFEVAKEEKLHVLIPCTFKIRDKDQEEQTIKVGEEDKNEAQTVGDSATQDVKTYVFPIKEGKHMIRLIDTPGMGDTRGIEQDNSNSESILSYIGKLKHLHAICYLLKSNETRCTVFFEYCLTQIFSRLDKSATDNLVFIFTNTRGTDYTPGDSISILQKIVEGIAKRPPYVRVPTNNNIFCFENEAFKYLAAVQQNIKFSKLQEKNMKTSWGTSSDQCWKLIKYITGNGKEIPPLKPHLVQNTQAINEARRMITYLSKPLADIAQLIHQNMWVLERHRADLALHDQSLTQLRKKMYMPVVTLELEELPRPATVCTSRKCAELYKVGDKNRWHYKQRCHDPCYLTNVPKEIVGSPELVSCAAMHDKQCRECGCYFMVHMHVYYLTREKEAKIVDDNVMRGIKTKEEAQRRAQSLIAEMDIRQQELEQEHTFIVRCSARFAHFLQNNAITPFTDSYKAYIEYLLDRERALGKNCDQDTLYSLQRLLDEYDEARRSFDLALEEDKKLNKSEPGVSSSEINSSIQELFALKHYGAKIKELFESQQRAVRREHEYSEYIHHTPYSRGQGSKRESERQSNFRGERRRPNNQFRPWRQEGQNVQQPQGGFHNRGGRGRFPPNQSFNWGPNQGPPSNWGPNQGPPSNWGPPPHQHLGTNWPQFPAAQGFPANWTPPTGFPGNWAPPLGVSNNHGRGQEPRSQTAAEQNLNLRVNSEGAGEPNIDITLNHQGQRGSQPNPQQQQLSQDEMKAYYNAWYWWTWFNMNAQAGNQRQQSFNHHDGPNNYNHTNQGQWRGNYGSRDRHNNYR